MQYPQAASEVRVRVRVRVIVRVLGIGFGLGLEFTYAACCLELLQKAFCKMKEYFFGHINCSF